jgi:hypothetical protein
MSGCCIFNITFNSLTNQITFDNEINRNTRKAYAKIFIDRGETHCLDLTDYHFRLQVKKNNNLIYEKNHPENHESLISTDQDLLFYEYFDDLEYDNTYTIGLRVINSFGTFDQEDTFTYNKPDKPYSSWIWSDVDKCWLPPVLIPEDFNPQTQIVTWNESDGQWDLSPISSPL